MTKPHLSRALLAFLASIVVAMSTAGCGGTTTEENPRANDCGDTSDGGGNRTQDDRSCAVDEDCKAVFVGDVCACDCTMDAIASTQVAAFEARRGACDGRIQCGPCAAPPKASCTQGSCRLAR